MPSMKGSAPDNGVDFGPALASEPVYERAASERWAIAQKPEPFEPQASGPWADTVAEFDLDAAPGPGFLDPGSYALANHVAPMLAADSTPLGAIAGASADLASPVHGGGGGGGGGKGKTTPSDLW